MMDGRLQEIGRRIDELSAAFDRIDPGRVRVAEGFDPDVLASESAPSSRPSRLPVRPPSPVVVDRMPTISAAIDETYQEIDALFRCIEHLTQEVGSTEETFGVVLNDPASPEASQVRSDPGILPDPHAPGLIGRVIGVKSRIRDIRASIEREIGRLASIRNRSAI